MKKYFFPLFALILIFSISCDTTSPEELDKNAILDILDSIQSNFNMDTVEGIMQYYHQDFLHDGDDNGFERIRWEIRLNDHEELLLQDIEIIVNGDFATASFIMHLDDQTTEEPSDENGVLSYFFYELGSWKLCGEGFISLP